MNEITRQPKLLKDYAPPPYLIEEVELDVRLAPRAARVAAKLRLRPNPKVATGGKPLVLDGEGLALESVALNGKALAPSDYQIGEGSLTIPRVPAQPFTLELVTFCDPEANTALSGLYLSRAWTAARPTSRSTAAAWERNGTCAPRMPVILSRKARNPGSGTPRPWSFGPGVPGGDCRSG